MNLNNHKTNKCANLHAYKILFYSWLVHNVILIFVVTPFTFCVTDHRYQPKQCIIMGTEAD